MKLIRPLIYLLAGLLILSFWIFAGQTSLFLFGGSMIVFLYLSLVPSPLYEVFPILPGKVPFQRAKKALGISSFFFALGYWSIGCANKLIGFCSLTGLRDGLLLHAVTGLCALFILLVLTITSIKAIKHRIRPWWKSLHRSVYLAGILAFIHAMTIPFSQVPKAQPWFFIVLPLVSGILLLFQLIRFSRFLRMRKSSV